MKKISIFVLSALLAFGITSQTRAEQSPQTASGTRYYDNQVFTMAYNNSGSDITSYSIVILDTTGTAGTTLGSYITTTTTAGSPYIFGVTSETITAGTIGRVCIRGPHKVWYNTLAGPTAGDTVSTSTTGGKAATQTSTANKYGYLGIALAVSTVTEADYGADLWWTFIKPTTQ